MNRARTRAGCGPQIGGAHHNRAPQPPEKADYPNRTFGVQIRADPSRLGHKRSDPPFAVRHGE